MHAQLELSEGNVAEKLKVASNLEPHPSHVVVSLEAKRRIEILICIIPSSTQNAFWVAYIYMRPLPGNDNEQGIKVAVASVQSEHQSRPAHETKCCEEVSIHKYNTQQPCKNTHFHKRLMQTSAQDRACTCQDGHRHHSATWWQCRQSSHFRQGSRQKGANAQRHHHASRFLPQHVG